MQSLDSTECKILAHRAEAAPPCTRAADGGGEGLESNRCVDSEGLLAQTEIPKRLVILGGGINGREFASIFRRFSNEVTIIEMLPSLIPQEDADAAKELR